MTDLINFDLNLLLVLTALYDERSVTRAAKKLGVSQPSVSVALRKLRATFQDELFVKTSMGVEPTPQAKSLCLLARQLLSRIQNELLISSAFVPDEAIGTFTLMLTEVGEALLLPTIVTALGKRAPHVLVRSVNRTVEEASIGMMNGEIDIAIGSMRGFRRNNLFQQKLFSGPLVCVVRSDHPTRGDSITLKEYARLDHLEIRPLTQRNDAINRTLTRAGLERKVALVASHYAAIPTIIEQTDLAVTTIYAMASHLLNAGVKIRILKLPRELPLITVNQFWHRTLQDDSRNRWLRSLIKQLFKNDAST